jgi:hypothetical protein
MTFIDAFPIPAAIEDTSSTSKEEVLVDFQKLFLPKVLLV